MAARAAAVADAPAPPSLPYRVGHGFDLHRLAEGYKLIIGGVEIPHTKGCEAHSDGARHTGGGGSIRRGRVACCGRADCCLRRPPHVPQATCCCTP